MKGEKVRTTRQAIAQQLTIEAAARPAPTFSSQSAPKPLPAHAGWSLCAFSLPESCLLSVVSLKNPFVSPLLLLSPRDDGSRPNSFTISSLELPPMLLLFVVSRSTFAPLSTIYPRPAPWVSHEINISGSLVRTIDASLNSSSCGMQIEHTNSSVNSYF